MVSRDVIWLDMCDEVTETSTPAEHEVSHDKGTQASAAALGILSSRYGLALPGFNADNLEVIPSADECKLDL